jgi:hypothetical protein
MRAQSDASDPASSAVLGGVSAEIEKVVSNGDLTGLREIAKEINRWLRALPPQMRREFEAHAPTEIVADVGLEQERELHHINDLRQRGFLVSEDEYRLVLAHVEEIYADPSQKGAVEELNRLLTAFDKTLEQRRS